MLVSLFPFLFSFFFVLVFNLTCKVSKFSLLYWLVLICFSCKQFSLLANFPLIALALLLTRKAYFVHHQWFQGMCMALPDDVLLRPHIGDIDIGGVGYSFLGVKSSVPKELIKLLNR